ncbi:unnamed protein product, partial [Didymodactylos carnosus]
MFDKMKHQNSSQNRLSTATTQSTPSSSSATSDSTIKYTDIDYYDVYNRILPHSIFQRYVIPVTEEELGVLARKDNPNNSSKIHYPFFIRKYRPNANTFKNKSPWAVVHPVYEQLINKYHMKSPSKEIYDQRIQSPKDLKYIIRLFLSYDKNRKGYLTNEEFHQLLTDNDIHLSSTDEAYYQLFSVYDKKLKDQFNYKDLF